MKTTRYFEEQVLKKRAYLKREWCAEALKNPVQVMKQDDDRVRYWYFVEEIQKHIRVVTLEDGETIHNAFPDRDFKKDSL